MTGSGPALTEVPTASLASFTSEPEREARAVVVPLARTPVRPETATVSTPSLVQGFSVEELLRIAAARGASTVYVIAQSQPMIRADGEISALDIGSGAPLAESDVNRLVLDLAPPAARDVWQHGESAEWMCDVADVGRVRCLTFRDHRGPGLIFRMISPRAISADQLGLPLEVQALCSQSDGLVLVTGPRASGKSTLMSAFIELINRTRSNHVVTIESQVGFVHESRRSFVSQREVRGDAEAVVSAARAALREDPDVLLIEDLRSAEIAAVALEAAESGRLVFGSLPGASTVAAIDRLLELFPADRRLQARRSLAGTLRGVVAQVLLRRSRGGRVAAREVLLNTPAVAALIEEGKTTQLPLAIESGRRSGMMPLNDALTAFVRDGTVYVTEAYLKAFDKQGLLSALKREGVDTSFAERLA
jgi:twitching motility protein PilT